MSLSKRVIETLLDLVEIKLSCIEVYDREDQREVDALERCRRELQALRDGRRGAASQSALVALAAAGEGSSRAAV